MICRFFQVKDENDWVLNTTWLKERNTPQPEIEEQVKKILFKVRQEGDRALEYYNKKFDCPDFKPPFEVSEQEIAAAKNLVSPQNLDYIARAAANIRTFHEAQIEKSWFITRPDGSILGQRVLPVQSAGLYVPGGKGGDTPLVSSLLMNAIPAIVAGCEDIAIVTPPRQDGSVNPAILAAAGILGLSRIYKVGGAWSIAALAYGTESIKPVDIIAGPGNIYVTTAKKILQGIVGIDMIAGPSEVLIIADSSANPVWVAADMLSQAEHDINASSICLTDNRELAYAIANELGDQLDNLPRKEIAEKSLRNFGCIAVVKNIQTAYAITNQVAPEHLELCVHDPWSTLPYIRNAGAVFMGNHSPEPAGDYFAGPNHVLPTLGTARFSSSLSVQTFCKKTNIIFASEEFLNKSSEAIAGLARLEGLEAHARSVEVRR